MERKRFAVLISAGLALALGAGAAHAQMYKWKDAKGVIHFSDAPPNGKDKAVELKTSAAGTEAALPYALAQAARAHPVTLFTAAGCAPCEQGRALLKQRGIPFAEKTIANGDDQQKLKDAGGDGQLPMLLVGRERLTGYASGAWHEALNNANYPTQNLLPPGWQHTAAPAAPRAPSAQAQAAERAAAAAAEAEEKAKFAPRPPPVNGTPDFQF